MFDLLYRHARGAMLGSAINLRVFGESDLGQRQIASEGPMGILD
jgi:hypothetical protein